MNTLICSTTTYSLVAVSCYILKRILHLNLNFGAFYILILFLGVLQQTGSVNMALCVWVISGLFSMIGAYCYAELGCMIKKTGADYAYIMVSFGPFLAFIRLWVECIIVRPCSQAIVALTFSIYACKPFFPECEPPDESVRLLAAICICK